MATIPLNSIFDILQLLDPKSHEHRHDVSRWSAEAIDPESGEKIPLSVQRISLEANSGIKLHLQMGGMPMEIHAVSMSGNHTKIYVDGVHDDDAELIFAYKCTPNLPGCWAFDFKNVTLDVREIRINTRYAVDAPITHAVVGSRETALTSRDDVVAL